MTPYIIENKFFEIFVPGLNGGRIQICESCIRDNHISYGINHQEFKDEPDAEGRCGCKNVPYEGSNTQCMCNPHSDEIVMAINHFREALVEAEKLTQIHMEEMGECMDASDYIGDGLSGKHEIGNVLEVIKYIKENQGW